MTELLKLQQLSYEINDLVIFEKVNATVQQGDVIGLIGKNGAGKSTLLQLLLGAIRPSSGEIHDFHTAFTIEMIQQETESHPEQDKNVLEAKLLEKWRVPSNPFEQLSGGEKLKSRLARGFSKEADLLLLDEPTNHLDQESMEMLAAYIRSYRGTIIVVSHDRLFLDKVTTKIWSIEQKKLIEHRGNYSSYMEARKQRRLSQQREYEKQQKMVERIETQLDQLSSWSEKAHSQSTKKEGFKEYHRVKAKRTDSQIKSKQKRLQKELDRIDAKPVEEEYDVHFSMTANQKVGKRFLEVKNLTKSYGERILFQDAYFTIRHGEKIALTGPNGAGKTTLLNIILGNEEAGGDVWISPSAQVGYLTQEVFDLPLHQTPEELFYRDNFAERGKVQNLMKHLGFIPSQWKEPIELMSMGERIKCKLMMYILEERDVLILDEPTNHLDLPSREQLEETLAQYKGTLVIVSHDGYFLEKTTAEKLVIADQRIYKVTGQLPTAQREDEEELTLKLETERQEVLGKLSFISMNDPLYKDLDRKFNELTKDIQALKNQNRFA
ncbi:ribosomal protection-like ABC-F family protein [Priestia koreensis]|uniref:ribosomal protection-like ABC-F family protein n=1 Tax=Priestia koreensis TaxID=284581 RepID=UPI00203DFC62|nr:ABC-F type ribosomal protection protein [Priestia koreensis]MCM3004191.1 ABC-F type ribosomal protection protein [Priestia koreensis]